MGLIIIAICRHKHCSVYEIFHLESEAPQLTRISHNPHLGFPFPRDPQFLLMPNKVIYCELCADRILFRIWDYRLNHSMISSADFDVQKFDYKFKAIATETTIIVLCDEAIFILGIPPLSPQSVDLFDHDPTPIALLRRVPFRDDNLRKPRIARWVTMSSWYSGSSPSSLYFDALCYNLILYGFEIVIKLDFGDVRIINSTPQLFFNDFDNVAFKTDGNSICENALVSTADSTIYFRSISPPPNVASAIGHKIPNLMNVLLSETCAWQPSLFSTSGRFVYPDTFNESIVVLDFL